jgi:hypothetical protein
MSTLDPLHRQRRYAVHLIAIRGGSGLGHAVSAYQAAPNRRQGIRGEAEGGLRVVIETAPAPGGAPEPHGTCQLALARHNFLKSAEMNRSATMGGSGKNFGLATFHPSRGKKEEPSIVACKPGGKPGGFSPAY